MDREKILAEKRAPRRGARARGHQRRERWEAHSPPRCPSLLAPTLSAPRAGARPIPAWPQLRRGEAWLRGSTNARETADRVAGLLGSCRMFRRRGRAFAVQSFADRAA